MLWWICLFDHYDPHWTLRRLNVSILVMMDLPFWLWLSTLNDNILFVSILVMMDLPFWRTEGTGFRLDLKSFNPCYDGFAFLTLGSVRKLESWRSFNPCYDGFAFLTQFEKLYSSIDTSVSILVMMDLPFWLIPRFVLESSQERFNPCYDGFAFLTIWKNRTE